MLSLRGQARALAADRILDHLHHDVLAFAQQFGDRQRGRPAGTGSTSTPSTVARRRRPLDVVGVQERGAVQPDLDERRLHARHDPLHLALVDVADDAAAPAALDVQFLQHAVLDHGHAGLARGDVDQDFLGHAHCALGIRTRSNCRRLVQRQSHHPGIAARQVRDERLRNALDRVAARLALRLAGGDVGGDLGVANVAKVTSETDTACSLARGRDQRHRRDHAMGASRQPSQHRRGIGGVATACRTPRRRAPLRYRHPAPRRRGTAITFSSPAPAFSRATRRT